MTDTQTDWQSRFSKLFRHEYACRLENDAATDVVCDCQFKLIKDFIKQELSHQATEILKWVAFELPLATTPSNNDILRGVFNLTRREQELFEKGQQLGKSDMNDAIYQALQKLVEKYGAK